MMNETKEQLKTLREALQKAIQEARDRNALEAARIQALGKQGSITALLKTLGGMSPEERREAGQAFNALREEITALLEERKAALTSQGLMERLNREGVDITLPARPTHQGVIHPLSQAMYEILAIFQQMGFDIAHGPDIEDDLHNFTYLNIPEHHPARQDHDTFYLPKDEEGRTLLLRTHTSPVQIRALKAMKPPLRLVAPGRAYRSDDLDQTHTPIFHQVEGIVIDKRSHMGHLKGCLEEFCRRFFENGGLQMRFRPGFFPFTEPSAEIDIAWRHAQEEQAGNPRWLEILGAGMAHPSVLRNCGLDPEEYQGFAFGMGVERLTMLKYGMSDLRALYESDLRWLKHYGFSVVHALGGAPVL